MLHSPPNSPSVRGNLSATSVPELLVLALDRKLEGSVVIKTPSRAKSALIFEAGRVTKVRTAEPVDPLGHLLMASGAIDRGMLDRALSLAEQQKHPLGASLLALGVLPSSALDRVLEEQLSRRVTWVGALPAESVFGYYAGIDFLAGRPACPADPLAVIWRSVRDAPHVHPHEEALLCTLGQQPLRLHPAASPERFQLSPEERLFVDALRERPSALCELLGAMPSVGLDVSRARRLAYVLALTRQLDLGRSQAPLAAPRPAPTPPPAARGSSTRATTQPSMAAVTATSPTRPSMPAVTATSPTRPSMPAVTADAAPPSRGPRSSWPPPDPARVAAAAQAFQAAHSWITRKRFDRAEELASQACGANPHNPEYLALHAWLRMQRGDLAHPLQASQIVAQLDRAVMKDRDSVSIRFYRAQVLKRLGRTDEAYKDFRFVARRKPDHIDAVREVRLHEMRARNARKRTGVLSRLFLR